MANGGEVPALAKTRMAMQIAVSSVLLLAGLYVLFSSKDETLKKWATGMVGLVAGYWLR